MTENSGIEIMSVDLNQMSRKELSKLARDIDKALASVDKREQKAALDAAEKAAAEHGFSLSELTGAASGGKKKKAGSVNPPKFRNPEDATQTWSGRGRKPAWINAAEAAGKDIAAFEI